MTSVSDHDAEEFARRRKSRNRAMLFVLLGLVALFYVMTIARMGGY
jgi:nitrate reductase NapE component